MDDESGIPSLQGGEDVKNDSLHNLCVAKRYATVVNTARVEDFGDFFSCLNRGFFGVSHAIDKENADIVCI